MPYTTLKKVIPVTDRIRLEYGTGDHTPVKVCAFLDKIRYESPEPGTQLLLGEYTLFLLSVPAHGVKSYRNRIIHCPFLMKIQSDRTQLQWLSGPQGIQAMVEGNISCQLERLADPSASNTVFQVSMHFGIVLCPAISAAGVMDKDTHIEPTTHAPDPSSPVTVRRIDDQEKSISELLGT
jgi:hypothetical protein